MLNQRNPKKQGDVGLGVAIAYFAKQGYTICIPLTDSQRYDLIVDIDGDLKRVQVKTTKSISKYGIYRCALRTCGGNKSSYSYKLFDKNSCDILFILCENNEMFLIPCDEIQVRTFISLGKEYERYKI